MGFVEIKQSKHLSRDRDISILYTNKQLPPIQVHRPLRQRPLVQSLRMRLRQIDRQMPAPADLAQYNDRVLIVRVDIDGVI